MADKKGTGGRGGMGTLDDLDLAGFEAVEEDEELDRSRLPAHRLQPLIDIAKTNPGRKYEDRRRVQAVNEETGELMVEGDGSPMWATRENGRPITEPVTYDRKDAEAFYTELRNAGNRNRLSQKKLSLRIIVKPSLKAETDEPRRVQFYVTPFKGGQQPEPQSAQS